MLRSYLFLFVILSMILVPSLSHLVYADNPTGIAEKIQDKQDNRTKQ